MFLRISPNSHALGMRHSLDWYPTHFTHGKLLFHCRINHLVSQWGDTPIVFVATWIRDRGQYASQWSRAKFSVNGQDLSSQQVNSQDDLISNFALNSAS